jgi:hypothetical protein
MAAALQFACMKDRRGGKPLRENSLSQEPAETNHVEAKSRSRPTFPLRRPRKKRDSENAIK